MGNQLSLTGYLGPGFIEIVTLTHPSQRSPPGGRDLSLSVILALFLQVWESRSPLGLQLHGQSSVPDQQEGQEQGILSQSQQSKNSFLFPTFTCWGFLAGLRNNV